MQRLVVKSIGDRLVVRKTPVDDDWDAEIVLAPVPSDERIRLRWRKGHEATSMG